MRMGLAELGVVLAILVLLFGAKRLPALADGMGKAIRNFKRGLNNDDEDVTPPEKQVEDTSTAKAVEHSSTEARAEQKS